MYAVSQHICYSYMKIAFRSQNYRVGDKIFGRSGYVNTTINIFWPMAKRNKVIVKGLWEITYKYLTIENKLHDMMTNTISLKIHCVWIEPFLMNTSDIGYYPEVLLAEQLYFPINQLRKLTCY